MYKVLLVDDDPHILTANEVYLRRQGYRVYLARSGEEALTLAGTAELDAVVLDVDMPGMDGLDVCRHLREVSGVPILFLSAYAQADDRIRGLMAGGDDYMAKPYSLTELELRVRVRIERQGGVERREVLRFGGLEIDQALREVRYEGRSAEFTALEFDLLTFLAQNQGQVFSYEQLYDRVWHSPMNRGGPQYAGVHGPGAPKVGRAVPRRPLHRDHPPEGLPLPGRGGAIACGYVL